MRWGRLVVLVLACLACAGARAELSPAVSTDAILISDIHFDPFQSPDKVAVLAAAPVAAWGRILRGPAAADREVVAAKVRERCGKNLYDTSPALLDSLLTAMAAHRGGFAVVTGDLVVHDFFCRYDAVLPGRPRAAAQAFAEKTVRYVVESLRRAGGSRPVYIALGNNDTDCEDYRLDPGDRLLKSALPDVARAAHVSAAMLERQGYAVSGRFSTMLPAPFERTRMVVLDDVPSSSRYATCAGAKDAGLAAQDLRWLRAQLAEARAQGQSVWFAAHIPPGVYARSTLFKGDLCTTRKPVMFLASDELTTVLTEFADVVKVALFGHTHMDEFRLLAGAGGAVPAKVIPAVSPISGNRPAFLVAQVDAGSARMVDYTEYGAPATDARADRWVGDWGAVYRFRESYGVGDLSAGALQGLLDRFAVEPLEGASAAANYVRWYGGGAAEYGIGPVWKTYQCLLKNTGEKAFLDCACPAPTEGR